MTAQRGPVPRFSLRRWSRQKLEAKTAPAPTAAAATVPATTPVPAVPTPVELPPVESLSFESDFAAFLRPDVDDQLKRAALKQLFRDPRFNVMDGLDTYIDDYTKADPIAPDTLADLLERGFGRGGEAGQDPMSGVRAADTQTTATPPATAEGSAPNSTPARPAPSESSADEDPSAQRGSEAADSTGHDEPIHVKRTDASQ